MFGFERTEYDVKVYEEKIKDFLPEKIIDVHTHVYKFDPDYVRPDNEGLVSWTRMVAQDCEIEDIKQTYLDMLPGKKVTPVIFANPAENLDVGNPYIEECMKQGYKGLYCTRFDTTADEIRDAILNKGFMGIKPYLCNSPSYIPANEIRIFDFLTHEHLQVINELKAIVILHIARPGRLKDPVNVAQLMEIEEKYPDVKLVVAHIGRAYAPEDLGDAFETLKKTKNMMFDFCANTCSLAMEECLKAVGPKRVMFGTDMPISKMRMRRFTKDGIYYNVVPKGLYGDVSADPHMIETEDEELTNFVYEEILAFKEAAEKLNLSKNDIEDIFYNNAAKLFGMED